MVGDPLAVLVAEEDLALGAEQRPLDGVGEVRHRDRGFARPRGAERRLVDQVLQVRADEAGRLARDLVEVDVRRERDAPRVDPQDRGAAAAVRRLHRDPAVEPPGPEQRGVQHVRAVRRRKHYHALA